jgi:hypothetical protein
MRITVGGILETAEKLFSRDYAKTEKKETKKIGKDKIYITDALRDKVANIGESIKHIEDEMSFLQFRKGSLITILQKTQKEGYNKTRDINFLQSLLYNNKKLLSNDIDIIKQSNNANDLIILLKKQIGNISEVLNNKKKDIIREHSALQNIFSIALLNNYNEVISSLNIVKDNIGLLTMNIKPEVVSKLIGG